MGLFNKLLNSGSLDQLDMYAQGRISTLTNSEILECLRNHSKLEVLFGSSPCSNRAIIRGLEQEAHKRGLSKYLSY